MDIVILLKSIVCSLLVTIDPCPDFVYIWTGINFFNKWALDLNPVDIFSGHLGETSLLNESLIREMLSLHALKEWNSLESNL